MKYYVYKRIYRYIGLARYLEGSKCFTCAAGKVEKEGDNELGLQSACTQWQDFLPSGNLEGKLQGFRFCEGLCGNVALIQGGKEGGASVYKGEKPCMGVL